jgi:ATP:cob(I)alamin adenosyltransferase
MNMSMGTLIFILSLQIKFNKGEGKMQRKKAEVYTRTGDEGTTALFGGSRIEKDSARVEAYGTIDELCALISVVKTTEISQRVFDVLSTLQDYCHDINAEIASDEEGLKLLKKRITNDDVAYLENRIDEFDAELPKLTHFIVPTVKSATAFLNLARTVCRRAERRLWSHYREHPFNQNIIVFFNRLADLFFTFMRYEGERK